MSTGLYYTRLDAFAIYSGVGSHDDKVLHIFDIVQYSVITVIVFGKMKI